MKLEQRNGKLEFNENEVTVTLDLRQSKKFYGEVFDTESIDAELFIKSIKEDAPVLFNHRREQIVSDDYDVTANNGIVTVKVRLDERNMYANTILSLRENKSRAGYFEVSLHKNKKEKRFRVHRLVAEAFLSNENNFPQVNHIDGDKSNNTIWNLEWVTDLQNKKHAWENGLYSSNHRKREIECIETGKIYESVQKASELIPCDRKYLFKHLKGEVKSVKGLTYKYRKGVNE